MTISVNELIGAMVYRTMRELNKNPNFMSGLRKYEYFQNLLDDCGCFHLWNYPGTQAEISAIFLKLSEFGLKGAKHKFPSVFNFQSVRQEKGGTDNLTDIYLNLAFVSPVNPHWRTSQREEQVFKHALRPIYEEFFRQIRKSGYFQTPIGEIPHTYHEVFTTGKSISSVIQVNYGDYMDAIEVTNLRLRAKKLCEKDLLGIAEENKKVTEI